MGGQRRRGLHLLLQRGRDRDPARLAPGQPCRDHETTAKSFEGPLKGSSTYNKQLSIRFLGNDGAIVVSESGILFAGESEVPEPRKLYATWVLEKKGGTWHIAAYHNSPKLARALSCA
ncbi:SgcJ/EcaC family oxidoreductase [Micromonospora sp. KC207]|uniref:SgcJ/EcaC family oxidoreductase n=1 Tax=Micromonospora sp. KC207 TaxID=2530377 RepID=UPI001A9F2FE3|nr:SgcJ/EcaC family oxidoreductase [Micromonospora sp. KC207]